MDYEAIERQVFVLRKNIHESGVRKAVTNDYRHVG